MKDRFTMISYCLHTFGSKAQATHVLNILGRISESGGKKAFSLEESPFLVSGRKVWQLTFDAEVWASAYAKLTRNPSLKGRLLSDRDDLERKVATLSGMVRGIVYMQGGTK